jgi:hypothetical protein
MANVGSDGDKFDKFFGTILLPCRQIVTVRPYSVPHKPGPH